MALLQYQISVYGIYIERLMNPWWKLTSENIDTEEGILEEIVTYFDKWLEQRSVMKIRENLNNSEVDKYFISLITYTNTKTMVR